MIAYPKEQLDRIKIMNQATNWFKNKRISETTYDSIRNSHTPDLYNPNLFIRIGMLIFTLICLSAGNSIVFLLTGFFDSSTTGFSIRFIIHGLLMYALLELLIKEKKLYRAGIDDAILYTSLSFILTGIVNLLSDSNRSEVDEILVVCCIALPFLAVATIRFTDMLLAALSFGCLFTIFFITIAKTGESSKYTLPFLIMLAAGAFYFVAKKIKAITATHYWENSLQLIEILSLLLVYFAGNYFVVRTLSEELFNLNIAEGEDIPLAFFFYAYTILVPLGYLFYGLKNKDRLPLYVGLATIAISVFTFKYYYSLGHHELTLTIGGSVLIAVAWASIRYLKTPKYGITYLEDSDNDNRGILDAEALILAQNFSNPLNPEKGAPTGGGKFGGGGADGNF
jgi:hypothetical protein